MMLAKRMDRNEGLEVWVKEQTDREVSLREMCVTEHQRRKLRLL